MDDNTFQEQLLAFFGGTTGSSLGPDITSSYLTNTKSDRWEIGYTAATQFRGVDMGATPAASNTAFLDFNSLNGGTADYDTRLLSVGGEAGYDGRGTLGMIANEFVFAGNALNTTPYVKLDGNMNFTGGAPYYHSPTNQGRLFNTRNVVWSGLLAPTSPAPSIIIQLQDIATGVPLTGQFFVTMSNGYSGTGQSINNTRLSITQDIAGANPWNWEVAELGDDLVNLRVLTDLTNPSYPQLLLFNKTADPAKYLITGTVFYDTVM